VALAVDVIRADDPLDDIAAARTGSGQRKEGASGVVDERLEKPTAMRPAIAATTLNNFMARSYRIRHASGVAMRSM